MLDTERDLFFLLFAAGLGLVTAGTVNALRAARGWSALLGPVLGLLVAGGAYSLCPSTVTVHHGVCAGFLLLAAGGGGLLGRGRAAAGWATAAVCGVALIGYGAVQYDVALERQVTADNIDMTRHFERGDTAVVGTATTDAGRTIELQTAALRKPPKELELTDRDWFNQPGRPGTAVRRGPAGDGCNCHGWVFTGGRFAVRGRDVRDILSDNRYEMASAPRPGDLVIYVGESDAVEHTGLVRAVMEDGTVLVEGKWGWLGVYLHPVGDSPYGTRFSYYRSPRTGHLLNGLPDDRTTGR